MKLDPLAATLELRSQPLNVSGRANVDTGEEVLIGGFIVTGTDPKQIVLPAIGPSLGVSGVSGVMADRILELHDSTGSLLTTNDAEQRRRSCFD